MLDLEALSKEQGEKLAEALDKPIPDGIIQSLVADVGIAFAEGQLAMFKALKNKENTDGDA